MKYPEAKPEVNNGKSLTLPIKVRTPLEAYNMLAAGQPVDQVGMMYHMEGILEKDFFMMDKIEKLRKLSDLREQKLNAQETIEFTIKQQQNESSTQSKQDGTSGQIPE